MSEITPPPPPPPTTPSAPPPPPPTAVAPNPPPALTALPVGARLEAVIQTLAPQGAAAGTVEIDSSIGRLLIQTGFPLPKEGPLQLQITGKGGQVQLLITQIHGQAPLAALRALGIPLVSGGPAAGLGAAAGLPGQPGQGASGVGGAALGGGAVGRAAPGAAAGTPAASGPPLAVNLTVGATLTATLLRAGPVPSGTPLGAGRGAAAATPRAPGQATPSQAAATSPAVPGAPASPAAGGAGARPGQGTPTSPQPGQASSPGQPGSVSRATVPPGAPPPQPGPPLPGTNFGLRITAFRPAPAGSVAPPPPPPASGALVVGGALTGVVTGQAQPSGHTVVQTHAGTLVIATSTALPPGSMLSFEVLSLSAPGPGATQHVPPERSDATLFGRWPALEEALRTLAEANPQLAQQVIQAAIPTPGTALAANVLFFLVALTGDLRGWLGDAPYRLLQRLNPGLLGRLREDFNRIARLSDEPRAGDWRAVPVPFMAGDALEQLRLYMRPAGEEPEDEEDESRKGTRFIVELDLSVIGRFQLDGLVYEKDKHMDLIVRTANALPGRMENDIRDIFENAGEVTGLKGGISFQAAPPNFVEVTVPVGPENPLGLLV